MLKPLLFVLVIVILLSGALHFELFKMEEVLTNTTTKTLETKSHNTNFAKNEIHNRVTSKQEQIQEHNLSQELQTLLEQRDILYRNNKFNELHLLYDQIIAKSKNSTDVGILKFFANASLDKARLYYTYPYYDSESAIELYESITQKLANAQEKELMLLYADAKVQQTQFVSKEESAEIYSELIEKFQNDEEQRFSEMVDELMFSKSFALMGVNDEEAMEVFDTLISKYDMTQELPSSAKYAIFNNIELSIITNNSPDEYVDMAKEYMQNSPDTKPLLEMLEIIKNAQELPQEASLEKWFTDHKEYKLSDWSFSELRKWVNTMEQPEAQIRLKNYLDLFEQHKYQNYTQVPSVPVQPYSEPMLTTQTKEVQEIAHTMIEEAYNTKIQNDEMINSYEPDPYLNDVYLPEPNLIYEGSNITASPDPYASDYPYNEILDIE